MFLLISPLSSLCCFNFVSLLLSCLCFFSKEFLSYYFIADILSMCCKWLKFIHLWMCLAAIFSRTASNNNQQQQKICKKKFKRKEKYFRERQEQVKKCMLSWLNVLWEAHKEIIANILTITWHFTVIENETLMSNFSCRVKFSFFPFFCIFYTLIK